MDRKKILRGIVLSLLINGGLPLLVYKLLEGRMTEVAALSIATLIPLADTLYHLSRHKKLDVFAAFMAIGFILSILAVLLGGDEKLILLRESFVTGIMGLIFLGSLLFPKPLIYHFALRFAVGNSEERQSAFAENWKIPYMRKVIRVMTAGWGIALVLEAGIKCILVYTLSTTAFLAVSNVVTYGIIGLAIIWTVAYRRSSRQRLLKLKNSM
ncbi:VC0807 family protein [Paenibacillus hamazuiensis]|uniref:VC0807 family protein n=1 Tax=Paenibacillus hamazuiensis TaxID=2936508 RepID=UPI00200ED449|nr:VC0807 family protein [Paenibacillus hamazuiensis]